MVEQGAFAEWDPSDYLSEYYRDLQEDEQSTSRYFVEQIRAAPPGPVLCFGCGPTLHHVFLAAPWTSEIYLADYVPENLAEIERWRQGQPGAHDWSPFVRYTLQCESAGDPTESEVGARMELLRQRIAGLLHADASLADPLGVSFRGRFAAVLSPYCAESITSNKQDWAQYCRNIASLVRPKGLFLTSALRQCARYKSGSRYFPATPIDEADLREVLLRDFREDSVAVEVREVLDHASQGFSGILLARGEKA